MKGDEIVNFLMHLFTETGLMVDIMFILFGVMVYFMIVEEGEE